MLLPATGENIRVKSRCEPARSMMSLASEALRVEYRDWGNVIYMQRMPCCSSDVAGMSFVHEESDAV